jgi:hypothetical protein
MRLHQALEAWELGAIEQLLKAPAINVDETSDTQISRILS